MTRFIKDGIKLMSPVIDIDLDLDTASSSDWQNHNFSGVCVLTTDVDVSLSITGFWGLNATLELAVTCAGSKEIELALLQSNATDEDQAVLELNTAIDVLLMKYLPTQGWQMI